MVEMVRCIPRKVRGASGHEHIISGEGLRCYEGCAGSSEGTQGLVWGVPPLHLRAGLTELHTGRNLTGNKSRSLRTTIANGHLASTVTGHISPQQIASQTGMVDGSCRMPDWSRINIPGNIRSSSKPWSIEKIRLALRGSWVHGGSSIWGSQRASCSKMNMG